MNAETFRHMIQAFPGLHGKLRGGYTGFVPFDSDVVKRLCASSYVIPFVSETECLVTRRENGQWVLPGGTLEPEEDWVSAGHRELLEETGCALEDLHPVGMYHCISQSDTPLRPHLPHPEHVRVVSWANAKQVREPTDPDTNSKIAEIRVIQYDEAKDLFGETSPDFGDLYTFAYRAKQM